MTIKVDFEKPKRTFRYEGRKDGELVKDTITTGTIKEAADTLRRLGIEVLHIKEIQQQQQEEEEGDDSVNMNSGSLTALEEKQVNLVLQAFLSNELLGTAIIQAKTEVAATCLLHEGCTAFTKFLDEFVEQGFSPEQQAKIEEELGEIRKRAAISDMLRQLGR